MTEIPPMIEPSPAKVREHVPADTTKDALDSALAELRQHADSWSRQDAEDLRAIVRELVKDTRATAERWAELSAKAKGLDPRSSRVGEEWLAGPYMVLRNLTLLGSSLQTIARGKKPKIPGTVSERANGQVVAQVFPTDVYDRIFYSGVTAEVWMQPEVTRAGLAETMAVAYQNPPAGEVSLVLGAGNVSSIGPMDVLYKLFVERKMVLLKMHPVNAYLGPLIEEGFRALLDWGVLRVVYGGVETGAYLCEHSDVDEIHITGSDKTVEAIVFGTGEEGEKRKAERRPKNTTPISSELGNVSPVIVVPGPWSDGDIAYQGRNIASMLTNNAGFNCNASRVIIQHGAWDQRQSLLTATAEALGSTEARDAYYPGAFERFANFSEAHPDARRPGSAAPGKLPWTLIPDVDSDAASDICFQEEAFCGVMAETALDAETPAAFIDRAVEFCNDTLWGTLNATLIVHPASLEDADTQAAFERALDVLRYGTISINAWAAVGYGLVVTPWGAYPGHDIYDIQSGTGIVHNTLMFDRVQKAIVRTPFRIFPKPLWFSDHKTARQMARLVTDFEAEPSVAKLPGIFWHALRG